MPRERQKHQDSPASDPTSISDILSESPVKALIDTAQKDTDGSEAALAFKRQREREQAVDEPTPPEILGQHTAAVLAQRPVFMPMPEGYKNVAVFPSAGIRVNQGIERHNLGRVGLQFAENFTPDRPEKDILERVGHQPDGQEFVYQPASRQWLRDPPESWPIGENGIDAKRIARELAIGRGAGIER